MGSSRFYRNVFVVPQRKFWFFPPKRAWTGHQMWRPYGTWTWAPQDNKNEANKPNRQKQPLWDDGQMFGFVNFLEKKIHININCFIYNLQEIQLSQSLSPTLSFLFWLEKKFIHVQFITWFKFCPFHTQLVLKLKEKKLN